MSITPIVREKVFRAPAEKVWKAITDAGDMRQWYFDVSGFRAEVGFEFSFTGKGHKGESYLHLCRVLEVVPGRKLKYSWSYQGYEGISYVTFELFAEGENTRLRLTHEGVESFAAGGPDFAPESFNGGWTHLVDISLAQFLEGKA